MWQKKVFGIPLQTGDILQTTSPALIVSHYGVLFHKNGIPYVAHNRPIKGIRVNTLYDFMSGRKLLKVYRDSNTVMLSSETIMRRTDYLRKKSYHGFTFNCEDFIPQVTGTNIGIDDRFAYVIVLMLLIPFAFAFAFFSKLSKQKTNA